MPKSIGGSSVNWAEIARYMNEHRTKRGWTQPQAADAAKLSVASWNALEKERKKSVKVVTLVRIALGFEQDPDDLLRRAGLLGPDNGGADETS